MCTGRWSASGGAGLPSIASDGLTDQPRPGQPRKITDEKVEEVIVKTMETTPGNATHWSTRSMAREVGLTQTSVSKIWRAARPRFVLHFTPTSSSWLNLVERWFAELTNKLLRRGAHKSVRQLNTDIRAWIAPWNDDPRPDVWTKTAEQILDSIATYCNRINWLSTLLH